MRLPAFAQPCGVLLRQARRHQGRRIETRRVQFLACIGYGAVFLILGVLFRNPILPAAVVLGWELIHFLLPPLLKRISVVHYLKGLIPTPMSEGPFAVVVEPPAAWVSTLGLLLFAIATLALAAWRVRRMEVLYAD